MTEDIDKKNLDEEVTVEDVETSHNEEDNEEENPTYEELKEKNNVLSDKMMRALAETENIRKKFFKEKKDAEIYGCTRLARDLLSVMDNLDRAIENIDDQIKEHHPAFVEGIELTRRELLNTFSNHEIIEVKPEIGEKFDPKVHQAMFEAPAPSIEKGHVSQVMTNGFRISERLLRAAQVGVSAKSLDSDDNK
jgi:molecular chaperone GrpE